MTSSSAWNPVIISAFGSNRNHRGTRKDRLAMSIRPLSQDELAYLTDLKSRLDTGWQSLWLTVGLLIVPLVLLGSAIRGAGGDRLAMILGGLVLLALLGGVIYYSGLGVRSLAFGLREMRLRQAIAEDLTSGEAIEEVVTLQGKDTGKTDKQGQRLYYLRTAERRYQVSGPRWLQLAPGQEVVLATARHSGVVLSVDGMRDRLPLASGPREEGPVEPLEF
jgi:hypothetical protein